MLRASAQKAPKHVEPPEEEDIGSGYIDLAASEEEEDELEEVDEGNEVEPPEPTKR